MSEKVADTPLWWMASISPCCWIAEWLEDTRNSRGKLSWLAPVLSLYLHTGNVEKEVVGGKSYSSHNTS